MDSDDMAEITSCIDIDNGLETFESIKKKLTNLSNSKENPESQDKEGSFDLAEFLTGRVIRNRKTPLPKLGLILKGVNVYGYSSNKTRTINNLFNSISNNITSMFSKNKPTKKILHDINMFATEGEMVLVLGNPGSGCTSLLKTMGNNTSGFVKIEGNISFSGMTPGEIKKRFKGEVTYNQEDDMHYSSLTVEQTLRFAIRTKIPRKSNIDKKIIEDEVLGMLLKVFGLEKCKDTVVGDAFLRGVSGGEKKRLSIAEQISMRSILGAWDGSTKGLDSSSALDYVKSLRIMTDILLKTTIVTIYQASEDIYNLFDKVLLLHEGRCIYFGSSKQAKQYFVEMGFKCPSRCTTADFLTMVTDRNLVEILPTDKKIPVTCEEFEQYYKASEVCRNMMSNLCEYEEYTLKSKLKEEFENIAINERGYTSSKSGVLQNVQGPYTTSWYYQLKACLIREFQLYFGNKFNLYSKFILNTSLALINGGIYFQLPLNSGGAFTRTGALYFAFLFNVLLTIAELPKSVSGRSVLFKQKLFAMYPTSAYHIAQVISDIPIILMQVVPFSIIFYFMTGMYSSAGRFFTFVFILFLSSMTNSGMFRFVASFSKDLSVANLFSNILVVLFLLYAGYLIPFLDIKPWFIWIYYINHLSYGFKSLLGNEFRGLQFVCNSKNLIPSGPEYNDINYKVCTLQGSTPGSDLVQGSSYLRDAYGVNASLSSVWINILIVACFWVAFVILVIVFMDFFEFGKGGNAEHAFKYSKSHTKKSIEGKHEALEKNKEIFWFNDINYSVENGNKKLLDGINGCVNPGSLVALMGSSGAGKTTLLNFLSYRNEGGIRKGDIYLGSRQFNSESAKQIGYCQQMDVHNPTSTVREALRFSAYLRQEPSISKTQKDIYVEEIIELLEIQPISDAIIGFPESGVGISLEARKKLSIGIELVARPQVMFLDEPTSGLDSQASLMIIKFLQRLAKSGQSILCTIHQPSAVLFEHFDSLILLGRGGKTTYFGEIGENSSKLISYFESRGGYKCPENFNSAEYILDVTGSGVLSKQTQDWAEIWKSSENKKELDAKILAMVPKEREYIQPKVKASTFDQIWLTYKRMMISHWRSPTYNLSRYANQIAMAVILGLSFLQLGTSLREFQNRVFAIFQMVTLSVLVVISVQPRYFTEKMWFDRESKAGFYDYKSFVTSVFFSEVPYSITSSTVFFILFYYMVGLNPLSSRAGYFYLLYIVFGLFSVSLGQLISAISPGLLISSILNPFFSVNMALFSGVSITYFAMPSFFKYWVYWLDPFHYIIEGIMGNEVQDIKVTCRANDLYKFNAPSNTTCTEYAKSFLQTSSGYLEKTQTQNECAYCPYSVGQDYLSSLGWSYSHKWRNFGILCLFLVFNVVVLYLTLKLRNRKNN